MKYARKSPWRLLYKFHRYCGLAIAIVLVMLSVTGLALNHTELLQLDQRYVSSKWLLNWYGVSAPKQSRAFSTEKYWITQIHDQIYLDQVVVLKNSMDLLGAIETEEFLVLAFADSLVILSGGGDVIERIEKPVLALGQNSSGWVYVRNASGLFYSDDALLNWHQSNVVPDFWSAPVTRANPHWENLQHSYRGSIIPYERLFLDLHSGRLFGAYGVLIVDITGVALLLLTFSGCWMWARHKLKRLVSRKSRLSS